jgi:hypothetical protein
MKAGKTYAEDAARARKEWDRDNGYYTAYERVGLCIGCIHFSIAHDHVTMGGCAKLKQAFHDREFAKKGVSDYVVPVTGICENFTDIHGIGLDGKITLPQLLPPWIKTRRDKTTGELFIK